MADDRVEIQTLENGDVEILVNMLSEEVNRISSHIEEPYVRGTIYKVPHFLRHGNEDAYTPKLVSIGPYHHIENSLTEMEDIKLKYFLDFTRRSDGALRDYIVVVERQVDKLRMEYSGGGLGSGRNKFVKMMVVDCCFVLEFLIKWFLNDRKSQAKTLMTKLPILRNDLLLVENQIPFFLLDSMFKNFNIKKITKYNNLRSVALGFFMGDQDDARRWLHSSEVKDFDHLLHLYHTSLTHPSRPADFEWIKFCDPCFCFAQPTGDSSASSCFPAGSRVLSRIVKIFLWIMRTLRTTLQRILTCILLTLFCAVVLCSWCLAWVRGGIRVRIGRDPQPKILLSGIPNACNLRDTGFSFQKKYSDEYGFMDVSRSGNKIKIPVLCVRESMLILFRNLMAFEQCSNKYGNNFTAYAMFMDYLVDTREDVAMLKECGIIDNRLGDDQKVADFFNNLCKGIHLDDDEHYLSTLFTHVTEYYTSSNYKVRFYRWRKKFIPDYFTNPWAIPSMIAALILLALAGLQTFYTIYPYYHPRSST